MLSDDLMANRQAQAHTPFFRGEKGLENILFGFSAHSMAGIADFYADSVADVGFNLRGP